MGPRQFVQRATKWYHGAAALLMMSLGSGKSTRMASERCCRRDPFSANAVISAQLDTSTVIFFIF